MTYQHVPKLGQFVKTRPAQEAADAGDAGIEGELQGPLTVSGKVELRSTARVRGSIQAGSVALAEGCYFEGHIHMEAGPDGGGPTSFQEKRRPRSDTA